MRLIDGGLSTELERIGAQFNGELWTGQALLNNPELVEAAHTNFVTSGAEVIISASYQLSRQGFQEIGLSSNDADRALTASIDVARAAVGQSKCQVAASVGPYAAVLHDGSEYRGDYKVSQTQLEDFHFERLEVLLAAKPDLLAVETIPNVLESKALAVVLEKIEIPYWISFTASSGTHLWSGEHIEDAAEAIAGLKNLSSAGVNCLEAIHVTALTRAINKVTGIPAIAYPNFGGTWDAASRTWSESIDHSLADWMRMWADTPIEWIGGCCTTDATHIAQLRNLIENF
jgi:S-methylmethionine-dependent homocysteine/selenocysteine methylase